MQSTENPVSEFDSENTSLNRLPTSELMKRVSNMRKIDRFRWMLTEGCGNSNCDNENCVSSGKVNNLVIRTFKNYFYIFHNYY